MTRFFSFALASTLLLGGVGCGSPYRMQPNVAELMVAPPTQAAGAPAREAARAVDECAEGSSYVK
jgi:hypothetical protein